MSAPHRPVPQLGPDCQHPTGCARPRLRYSGLCAEHDPSYTPPRELPCRAPLRCYCQTCRALRSPEQGPTMGPEAIRLILDGRKGAAQ